VITSSIPLHRISASYWKTNTTTPSYSPLGTTSPLGLWSYNPVNGVGARFNYNQMIRPTLLHHFAAGYTASNPIRQRDTRIGNEIFKLPGVPSDAPGFPTFNVNNLYGNSGAWELQPAAE
jgi:hypothetical protein